MSDTAQDKALQKKLVGAAVLILLAVIFLPMIFDGKKPEEQAVSMEIKLPPKQVVEIPNRLEPAAEPAPMPIFEPREPPPQPAEAAVAEPIPPSPSVTQSSALQPAAKPPVTKPATTTAPADTRHPTPAKPKAPQKSAAAPGAGAGYVVQVGSFSQAQNAQVLSKKLVASGFPAFVEKSATAGRVIYRVKVGPRPTRAAADDLRQRLIEKQKLQGIIVSHP